MRSPPEIADELAWAGVDMVGHANNHAFDYGSEGILETIENIERAGIILSGSGRDLEQARAPKYFRKNGQTVAHIAMASTYIPYGRASNARDGIRGRPGVNPLETVKKTLITITPAMAKLLEWADKSIGRDTSRYRGKSFKKNGKNFKIGKKFQIERGRRVLPTDAEANLAVVKEGRNQADIVVVSIHSHDQSRWLRKFICEVVGVGADIVVVHGIHEICPVEIIAGRPVFYGLGDFAYQPGKVIDQPSDAYEMLGLGQDATRSDITRNWPAARELATRRETFEGLAARIEFDGNVPCGVELVPIDLRLGETGDFAGCPRIAGKRQGHRILETVGQISQSFGTKISYDHEKNIGRLEICL